MQNEISIEILLKSKHSQYPDCETASSQCTQAPSFVRLKWEICYPHSRHRSLTDAYLGSVAHRKRPGTRKHDRLLSSSIGHRRLAGSSSHRGIALIPGEERFDGSGLLRGYCLCWLLSRLTSRGLRARGFFLSSAGQRSLRRRRLGTGCGGGPLLRRPLPGRRLRGLRYGSTSLRRGCRAAQSGTSPRTTAPRRRHRPLRFRCLLRRHVRSPVGSRGWIGGSTARSITAARLERASPSPCTARPSRD